MVAALDGIRVAEFANYVSGPYAGMLLGDFGAEVIKVESPDGGDPFRGWGRVEYSPTFGSVNRNKKSIGSATTSWRATIPAWCGARSPASVRAALTRRGRVTTPSASR
jgi:hypothetical protein